MLRRRLFGALLGALGGTALAAVAVPAAPPAHAQVSDADVDTLSGRIDPEALRGSFEFYRAISASAAQNEQRKNVRLTMPVLAMGGEESGDENAANAMKLVADDVQAVVLPGSGHWVAEQAPEALLAALTDFLAPYREAS